MGLFSKVKEGRKANYWKIYRHIRLKNTSLGRGGGILELK